MRDKLQDKLLESDPHLLDIYNKLVSTGVVTVDEFWAASKEMSKFEISYKQLVQEEGIANEFIAFIPEHNMDSQEVYFKISQNQVNTLFRYIIYIYIYIGDIQR